MSHAGPTRREIGIRTAFNLLGPLTNPAGVGRIVVGAGDPAAAPKLAEVLRSLGSERAFVVHGASVDELPLDGTGVVYDVTPDGVERRSVVAAELGLGEAATVALAGGEPADNARIVEAVLAAEDRGPRRDAVLLNAGAALVVSDRVDDIGAGIALAREAIDQGRAAVLLADLRRDAATAGASAS
jgi:anthranilate phosphoribosyltransferase